MAKEIHVLLKFINVIFCFALFFLLMYYINRTETNFETVKGIYDPAVKFILEVVSVLFIIIALPVTAATFFRLRYNQMGFVVLTFINLFLLFAIYYMLY